MDIRSLLDSLSRVAGFARFAHFLIARWIAVALGAYTLAGCNGIPVAVGSNDFDLGKCLEESKPFNDSVVRVRLADPVGSKVDALRRDDAYALSLGDLVIVDKIGNSLERCLLSSAKFGRIYRERGVLTAVEDGVPGFLDEDVRAELKRETDRIAREQAKTKGTESAIAEDLFDRITRGVFDALNEDLRAVYQLTVSVQAYDFGKASPAPFEAKLSVPQDAFSNPTTRVNGKMLLWRGSQIDAYRTAIKLERASPISAKIQSVIKKQEEGKTFASRIGGLFRSAAAAVSPSLAGFAESIGQRLGGLLDSRITQELKSVAALRPVLAEVEQTFVTEVPGSTIDVDSAIFRSGRGFELVAVPKDQANARSARLVEDSNAKTIFTGSLTVEIMRKAP